MEKLSIVRDNTLHFHETLRGPIFNLWARLSRISRPYLREVGAVTLKFTSIEMWGNGRSMGGSRILFKNTYAGVCSLTGSMIGVGFLTGDRTVQACP